MKTLFGIAGLCLFASAAADLAVAQQDQVAERVTALKASLAESRKNIRAYEWIETTVVVFKGEEKSRVQNRCYYGEDNVLQKVQVGAPPAPEEHRRGLRGRIAERKKEELTDEMKAAVQLVHEYVPPDATKMQAARASGKVLLQPMEAEGRARLVFVDYVKKGDSFGIEIDLSNNHMLGAKVSTYLSSPEKPITLTVTFGALEDGTTYVSGVTLDDVSEQLEVKVQNTGYRKPDQG